MPEVRPLRPADPESIGGYRLTGVLGTGGQGVVYKAVADTGREVAIKLLHSHLSQDDTVTRGFLREVEAARSVAAFCTAAVLDVGMTDGRPYIVSEYVAGDTLQAVVRSSGPRTGGSLDRLAISTLTALAAIHEAGIVHRDFKPGNVLMGPEGPIVIDFGIAKALGATTQASGPIGTPAYMSPEQFRGERVGPASDVFSWAGTMVFAATGHAPFAGETVPAILHQVMSGVPDLTGLPGHLRSPIEACLAKDPAARPAPTVLLRHLISAPNAPFPAFTPAPAPPGPPPSGGVPPASQGRPGFQGGGHDRTDPVMRGEETRPGTAPRVSRRTVMIGGAAAAVAAATSAFVVLRPASGLVGTDDGPQTPTTPTTGDAAGRTSPPSQDPSGPPSQDPAVEPFGTKVKEPVALPAGSGEPTCLAAGGSVVVCGTSKGAVVTWDLSTTSTTVTRLGDGGGAVTSVSYGGGRAASGHGDGRMGLWSASGGKLGTFRAGDPVIAVTTAGPGVAVTQKYDSLSDLHSVVRLWDIAKGRQIGPAVSDHFQGVSGLAFGRLGGDDVLVTGDGANRVRVRRLSDGKVTNTFKTGEIGGIELLACGEVNGRPVLVSTHLDATLRVYDLATGKRRKKWDFSRRSPDDRGATSLVVGTREGTPIAVVAHAPSGGQTSVRVWNLTNGKIIGELGPGPGAEVRNVTLASLAGHPVVVGTGDDNLLTAWSLGPT